MKTSYFTLTIAVFALVNTFTFGQIPNNGFENWMDEGTYMVPEGWWTTNDSVTSGT